MIGSKITCAVINSILLKSWENSINIDRVKLQKLIYFFHGHHHKKSKIWVPDTEFKAKAHGPGISDISEKNSLDPIYELFSFANERWVYPDSATNVHSTINYIIKKYGTEDNIVLSCLTNIRSGAWIKAMNSGRKILNRKDISYEFTQTVI